MTHSGRTRRALLHGVGTIALAGGATAGLSGELTNPYFFVQSFEPREVEVDRGETFDIDGTILNSGRPGTQTIEYRVEENTVRSRELTLEGAEEQTVSFEDIDTAPLDTGGLTHGVYTEDTSERGALVVRGPPVFEVTEVRPRLGNARAGEQYSVSATVTNNGEGDGRQTVRVLVDGEQQGSDSLSLELGESREVTFVVDAPETGGEYTHTVRTEDDDENGAVSVIEPASPEDGLGRELLFAVGGGAGSLVAYGAYCRLTRTDLLGTDNETSHQPDSTDGPTGVANSAGGSTVIESAVDENLDRVETALSAAEQSRKRGENATALAACYRARTAAGDAADAAREYAPDRLGAIQSRITEIDDLVEEIEEDIDA